MRPFFLVAVVCSTFLLVSSTSDARGRKSQSRLGSRDRQAPRSTTVAVRENQQRTAKDRAQSFGLPWAGTLRGATQLKVGERVFIRRPYRAFGTRTTVEYVRRAISETFELYPKVHVLSIGDISAEHGGQVSDHHSHQSGRDIDIGLFYKKQPAGYPNTFINATESNLDCAATWTLISKLAGTVGDDGGAQVIFLDYEVQGILFRWAKDHGVSDKRLERIFQYANGRDSGAALVHHYRNHAHHIHVRFRCAKADRGCS
ncbi:MAG: Peptidoglycan-binding lysin domain protein [Deltaproteobacteria bacterium]|nr:Peptidoglycan-binding lysin domain protein [Deltaproteobacteria bacterium]